MHGAVLQSWRRGGEWKFLWGMFHKYIKSNESTSMMLWEMGLCTKATQMCHCFKNLLSSLCFCVSAGRLSNCTHPLVSEHGGFRCDPSPCRGFPHKSSIHFFCEPGYHTNKNRVSKCRHGKWMPPIPACIPIKGESLDMIPG